MTYTLIPAPQGALLVGGGPICADVMARAQALAPTIIAADGGANYLLAHDLCPTAVVGDMDSISPAARVAFADRMQPVREQVTTDFDKALRQTDSRRSLAVGFTGGRIDHCLASLNSLTRHPDHRCLILSEEDMTFLCPPRLTMTLPVGTRLSLFPMSPASVSAKGLVWPLERLDLAPDGRVGTSNATKDARFEIDIHHGAVLMILPLDHLERVWHALAPADT